MLVLLRSARTLLPLIPLPVLHRDLSLLQRALHPCPLRLHLPKAIAPTASAETMSRRATRSSMQHAEVHGTAEPAGPSDVRHEDGGDGGAKGKGRGKQQQQQQQEGQQAKPGRKRQAAAAAHAPEENGQQQEEGQQQQEQKKTRKKAKPRVLSPSVEVTQELLTKATSIADQLNKLFPNPPIPLDHESPFQLLVAVMLSAQTTDLKVNEVTPALFKRAPDAAAMSVMEAEQVEGFIRTLGLAPTKARNLVAMSKMLVELHDGQVPDTFDALEALPGVGHKTASVVMCQVFSKAAFPVDTHIHRLAQRWGLTTGRSVEQTEADLKALVPESRWHDMHLQIIYFGRQHCPAQRHDPSACPICSWAAVPPYDKMGASPPRPGKGPAAAGGRSKRSKDAAEAEDDE